MDIRFFRKASVALCLGALATACVNEDYDLENIDKTMQFGSGTTFMLPTSSTENIQLNNLFSLTDGGAVMEDAAGMYYLHKGGSANEQSVEIKEINFKAPKINSFGATLNLLSSSSVKGDNILYAPGDYEYPFLEKAVLDYDNSISDADKKVNEDVKELSEVTFANHQKAKMTFTVSDFEETKKIGGVNIKGSLNKISFKDLKLTLPLGFTITKAVYNNPSVNETVVGVKTVTDTEQYFEFSPQQPLTLSPTSSNSVTITLDLDGAEIDKAGTGGKNSFEFNTNTHLLTMKASELKLRGSIVVSPSDITNFPPSSVTFSGAGVFANDDDPNGSTTNNKLAVATFSGSIHHEIDKIDDIELNDLPDFLEDDDVHLDLSQPQLFLKILTDLPTKAELENITLTSQWSKSNGASGSQPVNIGNVAFEKSETGYLLPLVKVAGTPDYPTDEGYAECTKGTAVVVSDLDKLLLNVPKTLAISGNGTGGKLLVKLDKCEKLPVSATYKIKFDYMVHCKLTFGPNFQIVYKETEGGMNLGSDLDDIDFGAAGKAASIIVEAKTFSTVPLDLLLNATPIDKNGNVINGLVVEKAYKTSSNIYTTLGANQMLNIRANANGSQWQDNIRLTIKATKGTINDYLRSTAAQQFDGLKYEARLKSGASTATTEALKSNTYLRLTDVRVGFSGGVIVKENK